MGGVWNSQNNFNKGDKLVDTNNSQLPGVKMENRKRFAEFNDEDINEKRARLTPQATKVIILNEKTVVQ